jgi:hypothetical protein
MSSKSKKKHYVLKRPRRCPCGNESIGWSAGSPICARCAAIEGKLWPSQSQECQVERRIDSLPVAQ